jgi:hypothetical protein
MNKNKIKKRLEYLRGELRAERISYNGLMELQSLATSIDPGDTELLEVAGVPEKIPRKPKAKTIWLVVQQGGASGEWYAGTYNSKKEADRAIKNHKRATYNCIGPYEIPSELSAIFIEAGKAGWNYPRAPAAEIELMNIIKLICADVATENFA